MKDLSTKESIEQLNDPVVLELFQQLIQGMREIKLELREMKEQQKRMMAQQKEMKKVIRIESDSL